MKCLGLLNSWLHSRSVFWTLILCRYNLHNRWFTKAYKYMCYNCMLTRREHYWKTDAQWDRNNFFGNPQIHAQELPGRPRAIPTQHQLPCSTFLWNALQQILSSSLVASALTTLSRLLSAGVALYSVLKHSTGLPLPTCNSQLRRPSVASTQQASPSSAAWVSLSHCCCLWPLRRGAAFLREDTMLLLITSWFVPSFLKTSFCPISSPESHPRWYSHINLKGRQRRQHFLIS